MFMLWYSPLRVVYSRIDFAMLKFGTTLIRSLVLICLATWILAYPLFLLEGLMAPQEYSPAHSVIRSGPVGKHLAQHYWDVRISSSTEEGDPNHSENLLFDELGFSRHVDTRRFDRTRSVVLTSSVQSRLPFSTSAAPRAPPSASL